MSPYQLSTWLEVWRWPFEAPVMVPVLAALWVHARGGRRANPDSAGIAAHLQALSFRAGLALLVLVLESPFDTFTQRSFAWHMTQHMVLLLVVPPLVLAGRPWRRLYDGLPAALRRLLPAGGSASGPWRHSRAVLGNDKLALGIFAAYLWTWHLPSFFDATLRNGTLHDLEHLGYLAVGMLYWSRAIASSPFPAPIEPGFGRLGYLLSGLGACMVLGVALTFATHPLYTPYLHMAGNTYKGDMSSQVTGGAIMWGPSMLPFDVVFAISVQAWLGKSSRADKEAELALRREAAGGPLAQGVVQ